jgi:hypothetical protein
MFHFVDGFFIFLGGQFAQTTILEHTRVQKVLIDGNEFVAQSFIQMLDHGFVGFHKNSCPCLIADMQTARGGLAY